MRMMVQATFPHAKFNAAVKDGSAGAKLHRILDELEPEAAYFTDHNGHRSAVLIIDVADASKIAVIAEPFFLLFDADCEFHAVMTAEDLGKAGLEALGKKWG
jgi:hypothetical protein